MRLRISIRGRVRPSVRPSVGPSVRRSVRDAFFSDTRKPVLSTMETAGDCVWRREVLRIDEREGGDKGGGEYE